MTDRAVARAEAVRDLLHLSRDTLLGRVDVLETAAHTLLSTGELCQDSQLAALTTAHQLISLSMFDIQRGTVLARRAEDLLAQQPMAPGSGVELAELALGIREAITEALVVQPVALPVMRPPALVGRDRDGPPRVLLIEDDMLLADLLRQSLEGRGCVVVHAASGPAGLEAIDEADPPTLVLLDIDLPGLDGHSLLRQLGQRGLLPRVPVLMLSARASEQDVLLSARLGAAGHITKPFSLPVLLARVEQLVSHG